jgi:hypothetical protein
LGSHYDSMFLGENRDHLNLIFPVYFDLMRQIPSIHSEGAEEVLLH